MTLFALTGSNSLASTGNWEKSKVIELDANLFNSLKTNQNIFIHYQSCISGESIAELKVKRKTTSKKYKTKKITLERVDIYPYPVNLKYYFYLRENNKVTAAQSDMAITITRVRLEK